MIMADAQQTRTAYPADKEVRPGDTVGRVNVYENNMAEATTPPAERPRVYPTTPVTRSSPSLVTWLIILALVVIALYAVVQFLT
jgi:hypothetical protein